jgi:hypothetical protein
MSFSAGRCPHRYFCLGGLFWQLQKFIDSLLSFFPSCFLPLLHCTCSVARFTKALDEIINSSQFYFRRVLPTISGESFLLFSGGRCRNRFSRAPKGGTSLKQEDRGKRERALQSVLGELFLMESGVFEFNSFYFYI